MTNKEGMPCHHFLDVFGDFSCSACLMFTHLLLTLLHFCVCLCQDPSIKGTFHWSGNEQMTKYEMACAIADAFNLPSSHLRPVSAWP